MADESHLEKIRLEKLEKMQQAGINPFQHAFDKTDTVAQALQQEGNTVKTAGRVFSFREHGNIAFANLQDETGKIQIFFQKKLLGEKFNELKFLDIGDFLGVEGTVGRTIAGEISIIPTTFTLLTKAIRQLPSQWYGLKDTETRYRQRYLDLLLNPEVRERFNLRTKLVQGVREYLDDLGFWEVETPALQPLYGGTNAKPFTTHINSLDQDMYLRIAVELYIKRLIAGGYERVYEIAKDFRNEGMDQTHSPEFTMIEWYEAYADYTKMMDRAEELLKFLANKLYGNTTLHIDDRQVDIGQKWRRVTMTEIMKEKLGLDVEQKTAERLLSYLQEHCPDVKLVGGETKGQLIFAIFDHLIPDLLIEPTWVMDYPTDISPLARPHRGKAGWAERYEGYIGGKEIFDGWTEITDPREQRKAWEKDQNAAREDKEEAQHVDEDFLTAMEYGMPPYGGIGIGVDRLVMLYTNTWAIKETILFPLVRREGKQESTNASADVSGVNLSRDDAYDLLQKYMQSPNLIKHSLAAEAAMKGIYRHLYTGKIDPRAEEIWGITGLLHDIDYEVAQKEDNLELHGRLLFDQDPNLVEEPIQHAIKAHNYTKTGTDPVTDLDWAITTVDQLTGLVVSSALIHPDKKLGSIDADFVLKRFNTPGFSKGVDRENIRLCESQLGIPLKQYIEITLQAMQHISGELGL